MNIDTVSGCMSLVTNHCGWVEIFYSDSQLFLVGFFWTFSLLSFTVGEGGGVFLDGVAQREMP